MKGRISGNAGRGAGIVPGALTVTAGATGAVAQLRTGLKGTLTWSKVSGANAISVASGGALSLTSALGSGGNATAVVRVANASGDAIERAVALTASGVATPAPIFSAQPSISPTGGVAGSTIFTANDGNASNVTSYTRRWLLSGMAIGTGTTVIAGSAGSLVLEATASGPGGATVATSAAVTVTAGSAAALPQTAALVARWSADDIPAQADNSVLAGWTASVGGDALAQATTAAQPKYRTGGLGGKPFVQFSGAQRLEMVGGNAYGAAVNGNSTVYVVFRNQSTTNVIGQLFGANATATACLLSATASYVGLYAESRQRVPLTPVAGGMESVGFAQGATGTPFNGHLYVRGVRYNNWTASRLPAGQTGISIGGNAAQSSWAFTGEIYEVLVWSRQLTAPEMMQVEKWARDKYGQSYPWAGASAFRVFDGDSITNGDQTSAANKHYPAQLAAARGWPLGTWANMAQNGRAWVNQSNDAATHIDPLLAQLGSVPLHLHAFEFINDIKTTNNVTTTQSNAVAYLQARRSAGVPRIVFGSSTDAGDNVSGYNYSETARASYNNWAAANWASYADAFVAIHSNANIGVAAAAPNASPGGTYFANDLIHLVDAGYAELASLWSAQVT